MFLSDCNSVKCGRFLHALLIPAEYTRHCSLTHSAELRPHLSIVRREVSYRAKRSFVDKFARQAWQPIARVGVEIYAQ